MTGGGHTAWHGSGLRPRARRAQQSLLLGHPSAVLGVAVVGLHLGIALLSPFLAPHAPTAQSTELVLQAPTAAHWLGTDHLGRDVLSRLLLGGRAALWVTGLSTVIAVAWGSFLGIAAGLAGGLFDELVMRLVDALLAIPWLLLVLLVVSLVGTGEGVLVFTLGFSYGPSVARVARGATLDLVTLDFVAAARARGESRFGIVLRELLPNVRDVLLVEGAMQWSWMLLAFSSLSFLGFGVAPPQPDWGLMIGEARSFLAFAPWAALAPIVALSSLIVGINLGAGALAQALGVDRAQRPPV